jgi:hypothetical protein
VFLFSLIPFYSPGYKIFFPFPQNHLLIPGLQQKSLISSLTSSSLDLIYFKYTFTAFSSLNSTFMMFLLYLKPFYGLWVLTTSQLNSSLILCSHLIFYLLLPLDELLTYFTNTQRKLHTYLPSTKLPVPNTMQNAAWIRQSPCFWGYHDKPGKMEHHQTVQVQ